MSISVFNCVFVCLCHFLEEPRKRNVQASFNSSHSHDKKRKQQNEPAMIQEGTKRNSSTTVSSETKSPRKKRKDDRHVKVKQEPQDLNIDSIDCNQDTKIGKSGSGGKIRVKTEKLSDEESTMGNKEKKKHKNKKH